MTGPESATPDYTLGYGEAIVQRWKGHTVDSHAAHLIPYLKPGLRVLDFGCGPGTISVGLARGVEPGELHGIDMEESQIEIARSIAKAGGHDNATFHVGDVTDLPFEDSFFDMVHGHAIFTYVPDTQAAMAEVKRVLKPGGIISCREAIFRYSFQAPSFEVLDIGWLMFAELIAADNGHPDFGKDIRRHLVEAGFTDIRASASFNHYSTTEDIADLSTAIEGWFLSAETVRAAQAYGVAEQVHFDRYRDALDRWKTHPGAFGAIAYGEAIARKP